MDASIKQTLFYVGYEIQITFIYSSLNWLYKLQIRNAVNLNVPEPVKRFYAHILAGTLFIAVLNTNQMFSKA